MTSRNIDATIGAMAQELAPFETSVADVVKEAVLSRIAFLVPSHCYRWLTTSKTTHFYKKEFFPDYSTKVYEDQVEDIGLKDFGVALICMSIKRHAAPLSAQMHEVQIKNKIDSMNAELKPTLPVLYSKVIKTHWPEFKTHYDKVKSQLPAARDKYRKLLIASANDHAIWYASDAWISPHTECFHHWVKYMALGASPAQVDGLIRDVTAAGFPVPSGVDVLSWRKYSYNGYTPLGHEDIDNDVVPGITKSMRDGYRNQYTVNNYFARRFTEPDPTPGDTNGPGMMYRDYGGSCFHAGTLVLMADRHTLLPVEKLQPGDQVWSPSAKSAVPIALIARPSVSGRPLYCFNDNLSFLFTDAHPFLVYPENELAAHVACVSPEKLARASPTWSAFGIDSLADKSTKLIQVRVQGDGDLVENVFNVSSLDIAVPRIQEETLDKWLHSVKANPSSHAKLYDVILDKTKLCEGGIPVDYVAGSKDMLLRVASEVPPLAAAELNVLIIMQSIIMAISDASKRLDKELQQRPLSSSAHWHQLALIKNQLHNLESHLGSGWFQTALHATAHTTSGLSQDSHREEYVFASSNKLSGRASASVRIDPDNVISSIGSSFFDKKEQSSRSKTMHSPSNEDGTDNFRSVMSYLYDQFIRTHTLEVRAFLDLGFRTIPLLPPSGAEMKFKDGNVLAVSVWGVEFHASKFTGDVSHCRGASVTEMEASIESVSLPLHSDPISAAGMLDVRSPKARYWSSSTENRIFYFSLSGSSILGSTECRLQLKAKVCDKLRLVGDSNVHFHVGSPYMPMSIALDELVDAPAVTNPFMPPSPKPFVEQARLWVDLRLLTMEQVENESMRSKQVWTQEQKQEQAIEFALGAGEAYSKITSTYIAELQISANKD